jgi:Amt family ammonium transporter
VRPIPGHNIPMVVLGTLILAFGWFGFNAGSSLAGTDTQIGIIATNTMLASAAGAMSAYVYLMIRYGKPDVTMICNGMLAGLVAITAPCAFVSAPAAVLIGTVAGVLVVVVAVMVEHRFKIDDPVGAIAVHGANGVWGVLSLGLFANGTYGDALNGVDGKVRGLFYGDASQFAAQSVGVLANLAYVGGVTAVAFFVIGKVMGNRVTVEEEIAGLDESEIGIDGYAADTAKAIAPELHSEPPVAHSAIAVRQLG